VEPEWRDAGLQAVGAAVAGLGKGNEDVVHPDVTEFAAAAGDVGAKTVGVGTEVERLAARSGVRPS
jgi:hypothetical protein